MKKITPEDYKKMQTFIDEYLPATKWDTKGEKFFQDWINADVNALQKTDVKVFPFSKASYSVPMYTSDDFGKIQVFLLDGASDEETEEYIKLFFITFIKEYVLRKKPPIMYRGFPLIFKEINFQDIGNHWSANKDTASAKGLEGVEKGVVLKGVIIDEDWKRFIDYPFSLWSELSYYEDEIALKKGAKVQVTEIEEVDGNNRRVREVSEKGSVDKEVWESWV